MIDFKPAVSLDTSFLFSLFDPDDVNHQEAITIFSELHSATFFISMVAVTEFIVASKNIALSLQDLYAIAATFDQLEYKDLINFEELPIQTRRALQANDISILMLTKGNSSKLLTFDKKLYKVAQKRNLHFDYSDIVSPRSITN